MMRMILFLFLPLVVFRGSIVLAQQEIGFVEEFALAEDRSQAIRGLIPGTEQFYKFTCLHQQNEGQLDAAAATLRLWQQQFPGSSLTRQFVLRQMLLGYEDNPSRTLAELSRVLELRLNHAPPSRDAASKLPSRLDPADIALDMMLEQAAGQDPGLSKVSDQGLVLLANKELPDAQVRSVVQRIARADFNGAVELIARELRQKGSRGFGALPVHQRLTLEQLNELATLVPGLMNDARFIEEILLRQSPPAHQALGDPLVLKSYLKRCHEFVGQLGEAHNNLKALVLGNLLQLQASAGRYDKSLFLEYLRLPIRTERISTIALQRARNPVNTGYQNKAVSVRPVENPAAMVREYLEHFLAKSDGVDEFSNLIEEKLLRKIFAETKILTGEADGNWYATLTPEEQKTLRDRVELAFAPGSPQRFTIDDAVSLQVRCKNVEALVVNVYQISLRNYYRSISDELDLNVDLDGLVPHATRRLEFQLPADRRHTQQIDFPEIEGRGFWVVDLMGGGMRSRAMIRKGDLSLIERTSDAGQQFAILDESGRHLENAKLILAGTTYEASDDGWIQIPFAERSVTRQVLLEHDGFFDRELIRQSSESYGLSANFVVDQESLISGATAPLLIATRVTCNGWPVDSTLVEDVRLNITATNLDGVSTSQEIRDLVLTDLGVLRHDFVIPDRLAKLNFALQASIRNVSNGKLVQLRAAEQVNCNAILKSNTIYDSYLARNGDGFELHVIGRNGEPGKHLALTVGVSRPEVTVATRLQLATDRSGVIQLGDLQGVQHIVVSGDQIQTQQYTTSVPQRSWSTQIHMTEDESATWALGTENVEAKDFVLYETRGRRIYRDATDQLRFLPGAVRLQGLESGDYVLQDFVTGQKVQIGVQAGKQVEGTIVGEFRLLEQSPTAAVVIASVEHDKEGVALTVDGGTEATRVHVIANSFAPDLSRYFDFKFPARRPQLWTRPLGNSKFIDSLRLDEEYQYILRRREQKIYPGNLLAQPSVLIDPWDVAVTKNERLDAKAGDAFPEDAPMAAEAEDRAAKRSQASRAAIVEGWKSFEPLLHTSQVIANLRVENGQVRIPSDQLKGYASVSVFVVNPDSADCRHIVLENQEIEYTDLRLKEAFDGKLHLGQSREIRSLEAGESVDLSSGVSQQFQSYDSLNSFYNLLNTIVGDSELTKFKFLTKWPQLSDAEKREAYGRLQCHEVNFFLYRKDREFFDQVVQPFIAQKMEKQFLDHWLLGHPIDHFMKLDRFAQLNAFEKVLLAKREPEAQRMVDRWLGDRLAQAAQKLEEDRFEVAMLGRALLSDSDADGVSRGRGGVESLRRRAAPRSS
ncbi:MAG TPA: hypothetical protein DDW52_05460, partial [Planctomycetaceae bacterium]|nr:hypothetical protein [Planctomycetaceae bacterium]